MTKIITENFRVETATEFYNSFSKLNSEVLDEFNTKLLNYIEDESLTLSNNDIATINDFANDIAVDVNPENTYYIFASSIDSNTEISNTQKEKREFLRRVIFGNRINIDNTKYLFRNAAWVANTTYESFDDEKDVELTNMFVTVLDGDQGEGPYRVFKCIRNNNEAVSTVAPSTSDLNNNNETTLSDGYVWKYMFEVPAAEYIEYATTISLPYVANTVVEEATEESVSDIIIEDALTGQFSNYITGLVNTENDLVEPISIESVKLIEDDVYEIRVRANTPARATEGAYKGMYLRIINPDQAEAVYDILNSTTVPGDTSRLNIFVRSSIDLTDIFPSLVNKLCEIVPKIVVSESVGRNCIAYGELDSEGTLKYVQFVDKGSHYKFATAHVSLPVAIEDTEGQTILRTIISPLGGHGSDPISEMFMSRIATVTNFFSSDLVETPDTNTYTKVGLVKNPIFSGNTNPDTFDNRLVAVANGDITSSINQNDYITQTVGSELITGRIHETEYNSVQDQTNIYITDYEGAFAGTFEPGTVETKTTLDASESQFVTINTVSNNQYVAYTGDLLHFIDFDPIDRRADRKEKIKFVFDF